MGIVHRGQLVSISDVAHGQQEQHKSVLALALCEPRSPLLALVVYNFAFVSFFSFDFVCWCFAVSCGKCSEE